VNSVALKLQVNGEPADVLAAFNDANDVQLADEVGWEPELHGIIHPARAVPGLIRSNAGAGNL
jgi:pectate lyase